MDCGLDFNDTNSTSIQLENEFDEISNLSSKAVTSDAFENIKTICYSILLPIILLVGCIGNSLNVVVFTRGRFRHTLDEIERSAATGLVALAISNLCFCAVGLPAVLFTITPSQGTSTLWDVITDVETATVIATDAIGYNTLRMVFIWVTATKQRPMSGMKVINDNNNDVIIVPLYYSTYRSPVINTVLFCSTWLLCIVSIERYLAVCHPIRARWRIRVWKTILADCIIFVVSLGFNMPNFLKVYIDHSSPCLKNCSCYLIRYRSFYHQQTFKNIYSVLWMLLGAVLPLLILAFCNCRLLMEIQRSRKIDRCRMTASRHSYCTSKITVMLISVVCLYLILVCPSTVLSLLDDYIMQQSHATLKGYRIAMIITNLAQAMFFSMNFGLYCSISKPFRDSVSSQILCKRSSSRMTTESKNRYKAVAFHNS